MKIKSDMKIIITGGSGFLGYEVAKELSKKYKVYIIDIKKPKKKIQKNIIYINCDIKNYKKLEKLFKLNFKYVFKKFKISSFNLCYSSYIFY